ncbi:hypothetical protein [Fibrella aquatica]|jgi:hypothetical protein|uniref:hypothetical protein n=1 Tax=Fibrella aquatica TaxID=3242487 RepID=UPI0035208CFC
MNTSPKKTDHRFRFLLIGAAAVWVFRGLDLITTGLGRGYLWVKHRFPLSDLEAINELTFPQWLRIGMFFVGIFMLYTQLRTKKENNPTTPETAE